MSLLKGSREQSLKWASRRDSQNKRKTAPARILAPMSHGGGVPLQEAVPGLLSQEHPVSWDHRTWEMPLLPLLVRCHIATKSKHGKNHSLFATLWRRNFHELNVLLKLPHWTVFTRAKSSMPASPGAEDLNSATDCCSTPLPCSPQRSRVSLTYRTSSGLFPLSISPSCGDNGSLRSQSCTKYLLNFFFFDSTHHVAFLDLL